MLVERIQTPALIIDEQAFYQNMEAMKNLLNGKKLALRPHYKSHKCAEIARMQIENGAVGITCAKLSEAQDLADAGIENILIANQIAEPSKIAETAQLAADCYLTVCVDNQENAAALSEAACAAGTVIHCYIEYEIGMNRCGVTTHEEVLQLAQLITDLPGLTFNGIQAYAGHIAHEADESLRKNTAAAFSEDLRNLLVELEAAGLPAGELSGGSTGTAVIKSDDDLYTELQSGSYLFMDTNYGKLHLPFRNSLFLLATIVSSREGLAIADTGVKSCGVDQGMPCPVGFTAEKIQATEEHLKLFNPSKELKVGDKIMLIPGHCCSTVNLHDKIYMVRDGRVSRRLAVTARGCSR